MEIEQGIAARLFHSEIVKTGGLLSLFEELNRLGVKCQEPKSDKIVNCIEYYQANNSEDFYFISLNSHDMVMSINQSGGYLFLSASLDYVQYTRNEDLIQSLKTLVDVLFSSFEFKFGYIDLEGDLPPRFSEDIEATRIRWLFWSNYFGKEYVDKFGKVFLLQAPGWRSEEMPNGTVKYLTRPSPRVKLDKSTEIAIIAYYGKMQKVKIYTWEQFGFD